ncbi:ISL3 family transposase [Streptomyces sp. NBC_00151]|uniref:ISL3 family transposase n=1 Tax=Streptomyces sp. NBC_00151 TaxID=2975669 RepID=UPI002DDC8F98|nr:ISL3 family transposase [Streptomyces sp. NBC_00151]WRZ36689.1 ISL3 family transposase [Streptomyces sp. NBC_00151]WRZ44885.1 ISL3 family transposase [Streptomyces sp. NBC_00151]
MWARLVLCCVELADLLPHLASVLIEKVELGESLVRITVRTAAGVAVGCPGCGQRSGWEHSRYVRQVADESIGGRPVRISVSVRRLYCENAVCPRKTFVEQIDGLTERYQRRTPALRRIVEAVAVALAGSAGARLLATLHHTLSSVSVLSRLMRIPLPNRPIPKVVGIDEFALLKGHRYATIITNADTGERIEVLPDRHKETVTTWVREHPGIRVLCRDGSGGFAQAVREADPTIVQVSDRWHLWHGLTEAVLKEVGAHASCWAKYGPPLREDKRAATTCERWQQVHDLLGRGVSMLECARRLGVSLNTVKRYARHSEPDRMIRAPVYRACLVDAYRDHLRQRRAEDPAVPVTHLLAEIREQGYAGSANLLVRYINQGRVESDHAALSPRKVTGFLIRHPDHLDDKRFIQRDQLASACPEMTALTTQVATFAPLLTPRQENAEQLTTWITRTRAADLPFLHSFANGLERDRPAVDAALTLPHHNGRTEGVNTKIKFLKRLTYGRAGHNLLRQLVLLN